MYPLRSETTGFGFGRIVRVPIPEMIKQISKWKTKRVPPELQHVNKLVKDELDRVFV